MGKGKDSNASSSQSERVSRPLSTLKDPSSFGPPPKNVNFHGGAALPNDITPHHGGLGAPLQQSSHTGGSQATDSPHVPELGEPGRAAGPALPYRANTTGIDTSNLPPPPSRFARPDIVNTQESRVESSPKPKPGLPPRLPSRQNTSEVAPSAASPLPPPTYEAATHTSPPPVATSDPGSAGKLNQSAINRLGTEGVSVPGLGIGSANPWMSEPTQQSSTHGSSQAQPSQNNELQARFSRLASSSRQSATPQTPKSPPTEGTTMAQKQAAFQTAQNFHKNPSSVSAADAKAAAITANNFRERHQEQISAGAQKANTWNKKYNITSRMNSFLEQQSSPVSENPPNANVPPPAAVAVTSPSSSAVLNPLDSRKPPPPPPPKKPSGMHAPPTTGHGPPPVPLGTKPSFG